MHGSEHKWPEEAAQVADGVDHGDRAAAQLGRLCRVVQRPVRGDGRLGHLIRVRVRVRVRVKVRVKVRVRVKVIRVGGGFEVALDLLGLLE